MADDIERFLTNKPGSEDELKSMGNTITQSGDFQTLTGIDTIIRSVTTLLMVAKKSYLFDSQFGVGLYKYVFEPCDRVTKRQIEVEVGRVLALYEDRATINFEVLFFRNKKGFRLNLYIEYGDEKARTYVDIDESMLKTID